MKKKIGIIAGVIIILFFIGFAGYRSYNQSGDFATPVQVTQVELQDLESKIFTRGVIHSGTTREVSADQLGKIAKLNVEEGERVKQGDILAEVDRESLEYDLKSKEIQLEMDEKKLDQLVRDRDYSLYAAMESCRLDDEEAQRHYKAQKMLYESGAVSIEDVKKAEAAMMRSYNDYQTAKSVYDNTDQIEIQKMNLQVIEAEISKLKHDIEKTILRSPIDGMVTKVYFKEMDLVSESDVVLVVEDMENLKVTAQISEFDIGHVSLGQVVEISCDGVKGETFKGKVAKIAPVANQVNNGNSQETTVEVEIDVVDKDPRFKTNFSAEIEILTKAKTQAFVVPYEAIYFGKDGKRKVFVVEDETISIRPVAMGIEGDLYAEVDFEGITETAQLVMNPSDDLEEGEKVTVNGDDFNDPN